MHHNHSSPDQHRRRSHCDCADHALATSPRRDPTGREGGKRRDLNEERVRYCTDDHLKQVPLAECERSFMSPPKLCGTAISIIRQKRCPKTTHHVCSRGHSLQHQNPSIYTESSEIPSKTRGKLNVPSIVGVVFPSFSGSLNVHGKNGVSQG